MPVITFKPCPVQLSYKLAESDKDKMAEIAHSSQNDAQAMPASSPSSESEGKMVDALPPLKYLPNDDEGWTSFDKPVLYVYAGKGPYVGRQVAFNKYSSEY